MERQSIPLALLVLLTLAACGTDKSEVTVNQATSTVSSHGAVAYQRLGPVEDVSYKAARRATARIQIPVGRTREEVSDALKRAAEELAREERAKAVMIYAFRPGDDTNGIYTVGRAIHAPNGRWEDAAGPGSMQTVVELGTVYFSDSEASSRFAGGIR